MGESQHPDPGSGMNNPDHIFYDNLTKFIWVKNDTKTYKNRKNDCNIRKIRINTRVNRTEKIHEKEGKKSAKIYSDRGLLYK